MPKKPSRPRKQSRRTVHISRETYDRIAAHRDATGEPMSALLERVLEPILNDTKETT